MVAGDRVRVVGFNGSLREHSLSRSAMMHALRSAEAVGAEIEVLDIGALALPIYVPERERDDYPPDLGRLLAAVRGADALVWTAPAYHGTIGGALKNILDYLEFLADDEPSYLTGKCVGLIATAGGVQAAVNTVNTMVCVAQALRAWVAPVQVPIGKPWEAVAESGDVTDERIADLLTLLGRQLVEFCRSPVRTVG